MDYSVKAKDIQKEQQIFVDVWEHYKKFYKAEDTEEYWSKQIEDCEALLGKYNDSMLIKDIMLAISKELERKSKN